MGWLMQHLPIPVNPQQVMSMIKSKEEARQILRRVLTEGIDNENSRIGLIETIVDLLGEPPYDKYLLKYAILLVEIYGALHPEFKEQQELKRALWEEFQRQVEEGEQGEHAGESEGEAATEDRGEAESSS